MELRGKQLGLVGVGRIGRAVAEKAPAFGMTVAYTARRDAGIPGAVQMPLDQLLTTSDIVSLHVPMTPDTRHLMDQKALMRMKRGAYLINTSRGPIVNEAAMLAALHAGKITAALDVFDKEPLPVDHPLRSAPNTVLMPHMGYGTKETWDGFYPQMIENALGFMDGKPVRVTNPEAIGKA